MIQLDADQERDAQRIAREQTLAAADTSKMSGGKTLVALRVAQLRNAETILVIAPLQTRLGWKKEAEKIGLDLPFHWIRNHKDGRTAMTLLEFGEPGIYFVGPQYATIQNWEKVTDKNGNPLRGDGNKIIKRKSKFWANIKPDLLIIDEVHAGVGETRNQRHKFYASLDREFILALSGTPYGNFFESAYGLTKILWPDLVGDKASWKRRWCETEYDNWTYDHMKVVGEKNPGEYFNSLPCVVRREWKYEGVVDSVDLYVELSAKQRKAYRELEQNLVTWVEQQPLVIEFPGTLRVRLRQATLGMFSIMEDGSIDFRDDCDSSKLDTLKTVLAEDFEGEPALIFTDSRRFARVTVERLRKWGFTAEEWTGEVSQKKRDEAKASFMSGETQYIVASIRAAGTGTDGLQYGARNMAYLSIDDSRIDNEQSESRVIRRGQGDLVRVRRIFGENTIDTGQVSAQLEAALSMNKSLRLDKSRAHY